MFLFFFFGGEYFFVLQTGDTTVAQQMNTILTLLLYGFNQEFKGIFNAIEWNTGVIKKSTIL
jgi:bacterioferritin (cytochrome b1)